MFVIKALPAGFTASTDGWECASKMAAWALGLHMLGQTEEQCACVYVGGGASSHQPFPKAASPVHKSEFSWPKQLIKAIHLGASSRMNSGRIMNIPSVTSIWLILLTLYYSDLLLLLPYILSPSFIFSCISWLGHICFLCSDFNWKIKMKFISIFLYKHL